MVDHPEPLDGSVSFKAEIAAASVASPRGWTRNMSTFEKKIVPLTLL